MPTEQQLRRKIANIKNLHNVVSTMKSLAAINIRQYEAAAAAVEQYNLTIEHALQAALRTELNNAWLDPPRVCRHAAAIIYGSDLGMVGQFNSVIARFATAQLTKTGLPPANWRILAIGERLAVKLQGTVFAPTVTLRSAQGVDETTALVQRILLTLEQWRHRRPLDKLLVFYNHHTAAASYEPRELVLLPLDRQWAQRRAAQPWPTNQLPMLNLPASELLPPLISEFLFVGIFRGLAQSLASENASRLSAMQAAETNIDEQIDILTKDYHRQRQSSITEQLHDIISGYTAL